MRGLRGYLRTAPPFHNRHRHTSASPVPPTIPTLLETPTTSTASKHKKQQAHTRTFARKQQRPKECCYSGPCPTARPPRKAPLTLANNAFSTAIPRSKLPVAQARRASIHDQRGSAPVTGNPISDAALSQTASTLEVGSCRNEGTSHGESILSASRSPLADSIPAL